MEKINPIKQEKLKKLQALTELSPSSSYPHHWRDRIDSIEEVRKHWRDQEENSALFAENKPSLPPVLKSKGAGTDEQHSSLQQKTPEEAKKTPTKEQKTFYLAGRLMRKRDMGKAAFFNIQQGMKSLQCYIKKQDFPPPLERTENIKRGETRDQTGEQARDQTRDQTGDAQKKSDPLSNPLQPPSLIHPWSLWKLADIGDILGVQGKAFKTKKGELSLRVEGLIMLCKSLEALPEKYHGLEDKELKYRYRHLHLIMDKEAKKVFEIRSSLIREIRSFMHKKGFMEVETPVLQPIYGGAMAEPFETQFRRLSGQKMYLKISPEIYLKKLLVGGFEKVFEIGKNFRNEGIDKSHNPEFTMMEYYQAYTDYKYQLWQFEELVCHITKAINKKYRKTERMSFVGENSPEENKNLTEGNKKPIKLGPIEENLTEENLLKFEYQNRELDLSRPWTRISHKEFENLIYHFTTKIEEFRAFIERAAGGPLIDNSILSSFWPKFWKTVRVYLKQEKSKQAENQSEENRGKNPKAKPFATAETFFAHFWQSLLTDFQFKLEILKDSSEVENTGDNREDSLKAENFSGPKKAREIFLKISCLIKNKPLFNSNKEGLRIEQETEPLIEKETEKGIEQGIGQGLKQQEIKQKLEVELFRACKKISVFLSYSKWINPKEDYSEFENILQAGFKLLKSTQPTENTQPTEKEEEKTNTEKLLREAISLTERKKQELLSTALEATVEKEFWDPIFVTDFPLSLSPLAKRHRSLPNFAERFEPYIAGMEIGNAYTELNDPQEQRQRLMQQKRRTEKLSQSPLPQSSKEKVGEEKKGSIPLDENFLHALEVGMPPTAGVGLGIERLVMILSDQSNIKDSILFPILREKSS